MSNKKFFALVFCMAMLFAVLFSAGCGGNGSPLGNGNLDDEVSSDIPAPNPEPENEDINDSQDITPNPEPNHSGYFTVIFESNGGTAIENQEVTSLEAVIEPVEPEKEGFTFMGWRDPENDNNLFMFGVSIDRDIVLEAEWAETISATEEELAELKKSEYEGSMALSLDNGGALTNLEIQYQAEGFALVGANELTNGPMNNGRANRFSCRNLERRRRNQRSSD